MYILLGTASPTLSLERVQPVHGPTCPGGDVVFVCNATFSSRFFSFQWRDPMNITTVAQFSYDQLPAPDIHFKGFVTTARAVPPDFTIHSTATLMGALLSHNNMVLQCWYTSLLFADETVTIAGCCCTYQ